MKDQDVYVRTEMGIETIRTRREALSPDLRVVFFMIDGHSPAEEILAQVSGLGVTAEAFDRLVAEGFVVLQAPPAAAPAAAEGSPDAKPAAGPDRFFIARQFLNETVVNAVGLRSFFFTLKLEKANSLSDLRLLLPDYFKHIEKGTGKLEAEVLTRKARELTSDSGPTRRAGPGAT
jgi:predicted secreted protein